MFPAKADSYHSLLRQENTWSRIQITAQHFNTLAAYIGISSSFFDLIRGFGCKFEPLDENHVEYHSSTVYMPGTDSQ